MTTKSILVQVRMPPHLVQLLDRLAAEGVYSNRSEAIVDGVRRLVLAFETKDPFRQKILNSYLGRTRTGSIDDLRPILDREGIMRGIQDAFGTTGIDEILSEVRR
jgi:Arc/MetJ-type ribon-helix-helix transcriptional regulator